VAIAITTLLAAVAPDIPGFVRAESFAPSVVIIAPGLAIFALVVPISPGGCDCGDNASDCDPGYDTGGTVIIVVLVVAVVIPCRCGGGKQHCACPKACNHSFR